MFKSDTAKLVIRELKNLGLPVKEIKNPIYWAKYKRNFSPTVAIFQGTYTLKSLNPDWTFQQALEKDCELFFLGHPNDKCVEEEPRSTPKNIQKERNLRNKLMKTII